jgi:UDP-N-acetylmuramoylalanine--D-glutamate ligase
VEQGVPVLGDIELFAQVVKAPLAVVTGSNGKSTVTSLLGEMALAAGRQVKVGGNLGEPALDLLSEGTELYLLELSSFQLETTYSLKPKVAVVLNVSADHMDRYEGLQAYADTKAKVYEQAEIRVFNRDDPLVMAMCQGNQGNLFFTLGDPGPGTFGLRRVDGETWVAHGEENLFPASELRLPGRHNLGNALAALAMGTALDLPLVAMREALRSFRGLPHRTEFVAEHEGVTWYNDSKGTNPGACIAALEGLHPEEGESRTVLIAGGDSKGGDFSPLAPVVERTARAVVLIGRDAPQIEQALGDAAPLLHARDLDDAVAQAAAQALPGDRVLLSPACASFDMFRNYEQRGEVFMAAVGRLMQ